MEFDWACIKDVLKRPGLDLVLGYNTALFNFAERLKGRRIVMNMDGIEWKRAKWSLPARAWFFLNELAGANLCHVAVADHPEIAKHVAARSAKKPVMIPYGSERINKADEKHIRDLGLEPFRFFVSIARLEPENSILELIEAFSSLRLDAKLAILGNLDPTNAYHRRLRDAAGANVMFMGGIYELAKVQALRYYAAAYLHGHTVGGTNPSLVEALGAGRPVIAHNNRFNRWTAGPAQHYFSNPDQAGQAMAAILDDEKLQKSMGASALDRHAREFTFDHVHSRYEEVLLEAARF